MKKIISTLLIPLIMASCATYRAAPLEDLPKDSLQKVRGTGGLLIGVKKFESLDNEKYLGRDLAHSFVEVLQFTYDNPTSNTFEVTEESLSLPTLSPTRVARSKRYLPTPRFVGYTLGIPLAGIAFAISLDPLGDSGIENIQGALAIGSIIVGPLIGITAGFSAISANAKRKKDYINKAGYPFTILPGTKTSHLFFLLKKNYTVPFSLTVTEKTTEQKHTISFSNS
ncbi:MAG: hypothetical protein SNF33_01635 [Candidatus Algichlamydia australiensis]|nr:hypothetical protein [Chlamydiales bacterium]